MGYDFHRQKPISSFILDFFCHELMLGIEVDGLTHQWAETQNLDSRKNRRMTEPGITVLRFTDEQVMNDMDNVLRAIEQYVVEFDTKHKPTHP
jgi:very-short-patch-repair endonuclease